jgi:hypothetical protein
VQRGLSSTAQDAIARALTDASFGVELRRAVRRLVRRRPALHKVRVRISR